MRNPVVQIPIANISEEHATFILRMYEMASKKMVMVSIHWLALWHFILC